MTNANVMIVLPRLQVQNANTISGPLTWGFPAVTAFLGFVHALQRKVERDFECLGVGIVCHGFDPQVTHSAGSFAQTFNLTRNPLTKEGETSAFVEEGRAHLEISLVITAKGRIDSDELEIFKDELSQIVPSQRLAGGTILPQRRGKRYETEIYLLSSDSEDRDKTFQKIKRKLLPGFALVHRPDLLASHLETLQKENAEAHSLDALLDLTRLNFQPIVKAETAPATATNWEIVQRSGWRVPIPIGYAGISELYKGGQVQNTRDPIMPFQFVECLYSLGEWVSPHRLSSLQQLLWQWQTDATRGLYLCDNQYSIPVPK
jgi:CRISPR-associated protein Csy2